MNQKVPVLRILWYKRDKTNTILYGRTALRMLECVFLFLLILLRRLVYLSQICPCSQLDLSNRLAPDDRGWDGWMAPLAQWTWVWAKLKWVKDREASRAPVHEAAESDATEGLNNTTACRLCYSRLYMLYTLCLTVNSEGGHWKQKHSGVETQGSGKLKLKHLCIGSWKNITCILVRNTKVLRTFWEKKRRKMTSILGPCKLHLWKGIWQLTNLQTANDLRCCVYDFRKTQMYCEKSSRHFAFRNKILYIFSTCVFKALLYKSLLAWLSGQPRVAHRQRASSHPSCGDAEVLWGGKGRLIWQLLSHRLSQEVRATLLPPGQWAQRNSAGKRCLGVVGEKQTVLCFP